MTKYSTAQLMAYAEARYAWSHDEGLRRFRRQEDPQRWLWESGPPSDMTLLDFMNQADREWLRSHPTPGDLP